MSNRTLDGKDELVIGLPEEDILELAGRFYVFTEPDWNISDMFLGDARRCASGVEVSWTKSIRAMKDVFGGKKEIDREDFFRKYTEALKQGGVSQVVLDAFETVDAGLTGSQGVALVGLTSSLREIAYLEGRLGFISSGGPIADRKTTYFLREPKAGDFPKHLFRSGDKYDWLRITDR